MRISIVTSCLNAESFIEETIESVISQRGNFEIEYIVVDGASSDGTLSIIEKYSRLIKEGRYPIRSSKVTLHSCSQKDSGLYDGLARGFPQATGDVLAYINANDFYLPNAFSCVADVFGSMSDVKWISGMPIGYNEKGQITGASIPFQYRQDFLRKGLYGLILPFIQQESTFWRRELMKSVDMEKWRQFKRAGDFYLWHTFAQHEKLYIVRSYLAGFRQHEGQLSQEMQAYLMEVKQIAEEISGIDQVHAKALRKLSRWFSVDKMTTMFGRDVILFRDGKWKLNFD